MKWITNNFSLNMVNVQEDYSMEVTHLSELAFKIESKTAKNRLSQMDVCQELGLFPSPGIVDAKIGDDILVAQYLDGMLTYKKISIGDIQ